MLGTVAILLLGAFSRSETPAANPANDQAVSTPAEPSLEPPVGPEVPANLSPEVAEIVKLVQNHVDEGVILAFIRNSGQAYSPTAEEILYLTDIGLSQRVIAAMYKSPLPTVSAPALASAPALPADPLPVPTPPIGPEANTRTFYSSLAPYGSWLQSPEYGSCWQPTAETINPDWRPYVDQGQWLYTDNGYYWQSGYSWGSIAFHYGRWTQTSRYGWIWIPDKVWGPAWVSWRIGLAQSGWAPLPPGVGLAVGSGLTFNNKRVGSDYDFGIPAGWFIFVSQANLLSPKLATYAVPPDQALAIFHGSAVVNHYSVANHKIVNAGPGRVAAAADETEVPLAAISAPPVRPLVEKVITPLPAWASRREFAEVVTLRQGQPAWPGAPARAVSPEPLVRHHRWMEPPPGDSNLAAAPHGQHRTDWELPRKESSPGPIAWVAPAEGGRFQPGAGPVNTKSGK